MSEHHYLARIESLERDVEEANAKLIIVSDVIREFWGVKGFIKANDRMCELYRLAAEQANKTSRTITPPLHHGR